ncbi:Uncharacterised protein [Mycobacteroides abscessus subsp. abscessus]|nr:Uncharacterised protein [Mycobacteroides abscessus subsp. abscessus]
MNGRVLPTRNGCGTGARDPNTHDVSKGLAHKENGE